MASKRINITIQEDALNDIDARAEYYGTNRSALIAAAFEILDTMDAWRIIENAAIDNYDGVSLYLLEKSARMCEVKRVRG